MDETATRRKKINPKLYEVGWEQVPESEILEEQRAYNTTPMERQRRAEILKAQAMKQYSKAQQDFVDYIMQLYVRNGFKELGSEKLPTLIQMKYHSPHDAIKELKMQPAEIRQFFLGMQQQLYKGMGTVNVEIHNHYHGDIDQLTINE